MKSWLNNNQSNNFLYTWRSPRTERMTTVITQAINLLQHWQTSWRHRHASQHWHSQRHFDTHETSRSNIKTCSRQSCQKMSDSVNGWARFVKVYQLKFIQNRALFSIVLVLILRNIQVVVENTMNNQFFKKLKIFQVTSLEGGWGNKF